MRLDTRALATASALIWGGCFLIAGLAHLLWPGYATNFLEVVASIYPGYRVAGLGSVVVGTLYALVDGAFGGWVFAWCYNRVARAG